MDISVMRFSTGGACSSTDTEVFDLLVLIFAVGTKLGARKEFIDFDQLLTFVFPICT